MKISAVINTFNEEKNLERCLLSLQSLADEIIVVDMHSSDQTAKIAKKHGAKIFLHEYTRFVEPARNFALGKATGDWVLLIDADEELPPSLSKTLKEIALEDRVDWVKIPRKNIIFGKWICHSRWWPDFLVRFFRRSKVTFSDKIHLPPTTSGSGLTLEANEDNALSHYNFQSIFQFVERLNRYTDIQAEELRAVGAKFQSKDLVAKPWGEFCSRFFAGEGYKDGLHGLALGFLQAFSELVLYLKLWENDGFAEGSLKGVESEAEKAIRESYYWRQKTNPSFLGRLLLKIKAKIG